MSKEPVFKGTCEKCHYLGFFVYAFVNRAKINIHSFSCYIESETELTQNHNYILHTINWLQCSTTFLREFYFSDRRYVFVLRELIFGIVKDRFLRAG